MVRTPKKFCRSCSGWKYFFVGMIAFTGAVVWYGLVWQLIGLFLMIRGLLGLSIPANCACAASVEDE